jgi:predicted transcriptional regulator
MQVSDTVRKTMLIYEINTAYENIDYYYNKLKTHETFLKCKKDYA